MRFLALILILLFKTPAVAEETHIQLWHQMIYSHREVLAEILSEFEKKNPDIKVQSTYRETEELRSSYQSAAMGGRGPEIISGPSDQIGPFATMGIIRPLDSILDQDSFAKYDTLAVPRFKGQHYVVGDSVGNNLTLIYNKKLLPRPPTTTDELVAMGLQFQKDHPGDYFLAFNYTEPFFFVPFISGFGESFLTSRGEPNLNTPSTEKALQFVLDLRDKYKIIPRECDYETANALFKQGKSAMIINGDWSWGDYKNAGIDFGVSRLPMVSETGLWPSPLVGTRGYSLNVHMRSPAHLEASIKLLKFLTSAEVELVLTEKLGIMPSLLKVRNSESVKNNRTLIDSLQTLEVGTPMPVNPEIRAIWDSLRTEYQKVLAGSLTPKEAAARAQSLSLKQIREMNEVVEPAAQAIILKFIFIVFALIALWYFRKAAVPFLNGFQGPQRFAYYMMLPAFLAIFAVIVFPFFYNIAISLSNFSLKTFQDWSIIGFHHYLDVFIDPKFYTLFVKTVLWTLINVVFHVGIGVLLALLIEQVLPAKGLWRTLLIIPWAVPQYITALTWRGLFNQEYGPINIFLQNYLHLSPVEWLSQPMTAFIACIITNVWLGFPFMMIVALGGLQSIPQSLYEAAKIDGASAWQRFRHITYPLLVPVMTPAALLGSIWTFNNLNIIWLVSNSGEPGDQTHILVSYVYKAAFNLYRYGYAAALSILIFIFLLLWGAISLRQHYSKELRS